jgi:hypothetical protein
MVVSLRRAVVETSIAGERKKKKKNKFEGIGLVKP